MRRIWALYALLMLLCLACAAAWFRSARELPSVQAATSQADGWDEFAPGAFAVVRTTYWSGRPGASRPAVNEARLVKASDHGVAKVQTEVRALPDLVASSPEPVSVTGESGMDVLNVAGQSLLCRWSVETSPDGHTVTRIWRSRKAPGGIVKIVRRSDFRPQATVSELIAFGASGAL